MNSQGNILIVDDSENNRKLIASILDENKKYNCILANDGTAVVEMIDRLKESPPDLILLDILMPNIDGFEVADVLKKDPALKTVPIIFITALNDMEHKVKAFRAGGIDYISKPFNREELLARVNSQIKLKKFQDELALKNRILTELDDHLIKMVQKKSDKIENLTIAMISALENANLFNDTDTGYHVKRVSDYSALTAEAYGCNRDFIQRIKLYSSLHDIGKVGIPDILLKKPEAYNSEEFEQMKQHVAIGGRMLDNKEIDSMAKNIALYHHEKWNGSGYLQGLSGEDIPLEARIVAIADVFDALTTPRVYKPAIEAENAFKIIKQNSEKHFEPYIVEIFLKRKDDIIDIKNSFQQITEKKQSG